MRPLPIVPPSLVALLRRQDGVVTSAQASAAGLSEGQLRTLLRHGWTRPFRGVLVWPEAPDAFRASVRAALLAYPEAVVSGLTAARLHGLWGLPVWMPDEAPHVLLPAGKTYTRRAGAHLRSGLGADERTVRGGFAVTTLARTVDDLARLLDAGRLVCLVESALQSGWRMRASSRPGMPKLRAALALADVRSESTFETLIRLVLIRGGVAPETLQFEIREGGRVRYRLDFAWPSAKLAVEADGRETHDAPQALYRDRSKSNDLQLDGWVILRFTWFDLMNRPEWIVEQVRAALNRGTVVKSAS